MGQGNRILRACWRARARRLRTAGCAGCEAPPPPNDRPACPCTPTTARPRPPTHHPIGSTDLQASTCGSSASGSGGRPARAARRRCTSCASSASASAPTREFCAAAAHLFSFTQNCLAGAKHSIPIDRPALARAPTASCHSGSAPLLAASKHLTTRLHLSLSPLNKRQLHNNKQADRDRRPAALVPAAAARRAARGGGRAACGALGVGGAVLGTGARS